MSRTRLIRLGFFKNEDLAELLRQARILFAELWCPARYIGLKGNT
jgi:hypothetical protein